MRNYKKDLFHSCLKRNNRTKTKLYFVYLKIEFSFKGIGFYLAITLSLNSQIVISLIKRLGSNNSKDWTFAFGPLTVLNVTYSPNYEISFLYQNISLLTNAYLMSSSTLILSGVLSFITIQFQLLKTNIRNITENSHKIMKQVRNPTPKIQLINNKMLYYYIIIYYCIRH